MSQPLPTAPLPTAPEAPVAPNGQPFHPCGCGVPNNAHKSRHRPGCGWGLTPKQNTPVYEGADPMNSLLRNWEEPLVTEDEALEHDAADLTAKSRALFRNTGNLAGAMKTMTDTTVGTHFKGRPRVNWKRIPGMSEADARELNYNIRCALEADAEDEACFVDARETRTVRQGAALAFVSFAGSGDATCKMEYLTGQDAKHRPFSTAFRFFDPLRIFTPQTRKHEDNPRIYRGMLKNKLGRNVAAYVHPYLEGCAPRYNYNRRSRNGGDYKLDFERVAFHTPSGRSKLIHVYDSELDTESTRGRPMIAPVLPSVKGQKNLRKSMLKSANVQSNVIATITSMTPVGADGLFGPSEEVLREREDWAAKTNLVIDGNKVVMLADHQKLDYKAPHNQFSNFDSFDAAYHAEQARCLGMGWSQYTGRFDKVNMSAARVENLSNWRTVQVRRKTICGRWAALWYMCWLEEQLEKGLIPYPKSMLASLNTLEKRRTFWKRNRCDLARISWYGSGRDDVDQVKTAAAAKLWKEMGLISDTEILHDRGVDFDDLMETLLYEGERRLEYYDKLAEINEAQKRAGLTSSDDTRYSTTDIMNATIVDALKDEPETPLVNEAQPQPATATAD